MNSPGEKSRITNFTCFPSSPSVFCDVQKGDVFFILAKGYLSHELGMLGFPAYDRNQLLLGFYKEIQSQVGQTQVWPLLLSTPPLDVNSADNLEVWKHQSAKLSVNCRHSYVYTCLPALPLEGRRLIQQLNRAALSWQSCVVNI